MPSVTGGTTFSSSTTVDATALNAATLPTVTLATNETLTTTDKVGYRTGAGSTVTQITSITTAVTINAICGTITTVALTAAAGAEEGPFTVNNSTVAATDYPGVVIKSYGGAGTPFAWVSAVGSGTFAVTITNKHGADALNAAISLTFCVVKGVTS